jgi:hypothetical protein
MNFDEVDADACMHMLAVEVADELRSHVQELYSGQHQRNQETDGRMANVVLAGLTLVWLEAVHTVWNTPTGESAVGLMHGLKPESKGVKREMQRAARDFLRRSGWWVRRTQ